MDILAHKYLGLETGDIWFAAKDLYFERVLGDMHQLPFQPESFDFVITTSSLHHTDTLAPVLKEVVRVLNAQGRAFFINEPVIPDGQPKPDLSDSPEILHNIIESRPTYSEWITSFEAAGLGVENVWMTGDMHILLRKGPSTLDPAVLANPFSLHRGGLRGHPLWRQIEHRFWTKYDQIKIRMLRSLKRL